MQCNEKGFSETWCNEKIFSEAMRQESILGIGCDENVFPESATRKNSWKQCDEKGFSDAVVQRERIPGSSATRKDSRKRVRRESIPGSCDKKEFLEAMRRERILGRGRCATRNNSRELQQEIILGSNATRKYSRTRWDDAARREKILGSDGTMQQEIILGCGFLSI